MRHAIYFTLPMSHRLAQAAADWLGRDSFSGKAIASSAVVDLSVEDVVRITAAPRRYGFHATLKAPFRLKDGQAADALRDRLAELAENLEPFEMPPLAISRIGPFFALTPSHPSPRLQETADRVVRAFEPFRVPLTPAEIARRRPQRLTERQRAYLDRWGYPYVLEEFRFHMTLTGPVEDEEAPRVAAALEERFGSLLDEPVAFADLALFVEEAPGEPFLVDTMCRLGAVQRHTMRAAGGKP